MLVSILKLCLSRNALSADGFLLSPCLNMMSPLHAGVQGLLETFCMAAASMPQSEMVLQGTTRTCPLTRPKLQPWRRRTLTILLAADAAMRLGKTVVIIAVICCAFHGEAGGQPVWSNVTLEVWLFVCDPCMTPLFVVRLWCVSQDTPGGRNVSCL